MSLNLSLNKMKCNLGIQTIIKVVINSFIYLLLFISVITLIKI